MSQRGVNRVILVGQLAREPETKVLANGTMVAELRLATSDTWAGADGQRKERTEWHRVVAHGKLAEIAKKLRQGQQLYVEGRVQTRSFEQNGTKRSVVEVVASVLIALGVREGAERETKSEPRTSSFDPQSEVSGSHPRHPRKRYSEEPESTEPFKATMDDVPF